MEQVGTVDVNRLYVCKSIAELNAVYLLSLQHLVGRVDHPSIELATPNDYLRKVSDSQLSDLLSFAAGQKHVIMQPRLGPVFSSVLELGSDGVDIARLAMSCTLHRR